MGKTTIVVVDDSPFASKQIKDIVEENGYEVIGYAKNGEEGIKIKSSRFIILLFESYCISLPVIGLLSVVYIVNTTLPFW